MGGGGMFGERFKMSAQSPFWSSREFFMITWPIQTLSSVPVFLDSADPSFLNWLSASLCHPPTEFAIIERNQRFLQKTTWATIMSRNDETHFFGCDQPKSSLN